MSHKSDRGKKPKPIHPVQPRPRTQPGQTRLAPRIGPTGWRLGLMRLGLMVCAPLALALLLEGSLRLFGYGYPASFFIRSDSGGYITNQRFAWQFFSRKSVLRPFLFTLPAQKPPGTLRVCILGESAAMGTPDPAFGFGRILEAILRRRYPETRFEVMNAAMRGINSHVIRRIAQECAGRQVDLFLIYMGNNEVVGVHGPDPTSPAWAQSLALIRTAEWVRSTRLGQLVSDLLNTSKDPHDQDMTYFRDHLLRADDWRRGRNRENFRSNLEEMLRTTTRTGAKVILSTVAVNLKDFPPLGSLHRADLAGGDKAKWDTVYGAGTAFESKGQYQEAVQQYLAASQIDDHFADLHFRMARCYFALGQWVEARSHYSLARDWDAMQFRTDSGMNAVIRDLAGAYRAQGVTLVDMEKAFAESDLSAQQLPGEKLFYEHVHPTFEGNYILARKFCDGLAEVWSGSLPKAAPAGTPTRQECAEALGYTFYDEVNVLAAMVRLTAGPPFLDQLDHAQRQAAAEAESRKRIAAFNPQEAQHCLQTYLAALNRKPDDWPIRLNLGLFYQELKQDPQAIEQFEYLVHRFPMMKPFRLGLANSLFRQGNQSGALAQLEAALRLDPNDKDLRNQIDQLALGRASP